MIDTLADVAVTLVAVTPVDDVNRVPSTVLVNTTVIPSTNPVPVKVKLFEVVPATSVDGDTDVTTGAVETWYAFASGADVPLPSATVRL